MKSLERKLHFNILPKNIAFKYEIILFNLKIIVLCIFIYEILTCDLGIIILLITFLEDACCFL